MNMDQMPEREVEVHKGGREHAEDAAASPERGDFDVVRARQRF
jgi:hypothetical protein